MLHQSQAQRGSRSRRDERRGVVLLIVIAMLSLFSIVALSFVFYAESEAGASALASQTMNKTDGDVDPELLLSYFISQLVYGTDNYASAIRGHSLADTKFGRGNNPAYSGIGKLHVTWGNGAPAGLKGQDDYYLPNCQYFPADGFLRDPEYYGWRPNPNVLPNAANYRAGNAPYTYPDMNNMFLARVDVDATTGLPVVVAPSFHRLYLNTANKYGVLIPTSGKGSFNPNFNPSESDPNTGANVRNVDNSMGFKFVSAANKVTFYNNDSYWVDLGFPWYIAPNGRKIKPMFACLVTDLDNRPNIFVAGNGVGGVDAKGNPIHMSNRGYTGTEINLKYLYDLQGLSATELTQMLATRGTKLAPGLYPATWPGNNSGPPSAARDGPHYARIDFNGGNGGRYALPAGASTTPNYPLWYSGDPANGPIGPPELASPWIGYNPFNAAPAFGEFDAVLRHRGVGAPAYTSPTYFAQFPTTFGNAALRSQLTPASWTFDAATGSPYLWSGPPNTYQYNGASGQQVAGFTSPNFDPGIAKPPYIAGEFSANFTSSLVSTSLGAGGTGIVYGSPKATNGKPTALNLPPGPTPGGPSTQLLRVNLNRINSYQFDYPQPNENGYIDIITNAANQTQFNKAHLARQQVAWDIYNVLALVTGAWDPNLYTNVQNAQPPGPTIVVNSVAGFPPVGTINVNLGGGVLMPVNYTQVDPGDPSIPRPPSFKNCTGGAMPIPANARVTNANLTPASPQWAAARWLAQLAVNIVDYIDNDDICTPFQWFTDPNNLLPSEIIWGTEVPRLVLNEVYAQLDNDPADPGIIAMPPMATTYNLHVWTELMNTGRFIPSTAIDAAFKPLALPANNADIDVTSSTGLPSQGVIAVNINGSLTTISYQNLDLNKKTLHGCFGGSGILTPGCPVGAEPYPIDLGMGRMNVNAPPVKLTVNLNSDTQMLPRPTINIDENVWGPGNTIDKFPSAGMIALNCGPGGSWTVVTYTGKNLAGGGMPAQFTGCSGGSGTMVGVGGLAATQVKLYNAAYQIVLEGPDANLRGPTNATGNPAAPMNTFNFWWSPPGAGPPAQIDPANGSAADGTRTNRGYYLVGPTPGTGFLPGRDPMLPSSYQSDQMTVKGAPLGMIGTGTTVLLRRLACPYLPPQPTPNVPNTIYNPYITVDYAQNVTTEPNLLFNPGLNKNARNPNTFASQGRREPYAGARLFAQKRVGGAPGLPKNSFYQQNTTLTQPFTWLTQLDRPLVNQLELLHVSMFRQHELTQQFATFNAGGAITATNQQVAPWTSNAAMIYRALDFLGVPSYLKGATSTVDVNGNFTLTNGGKVPGKININTLNDPLDNAGNLAVTDPQTGTKVPPLFMAMADPQAVSYFSQADVVTAYRNLIGSRSRGPQFTPSKNDMPFRSFSPAWIANGDKFYNTATGTWGPQYPNGAGIQDTLLRVNAAGKPLAELSAAAGRTHPFQRYELLTKLFNNLTTTSEVFAVWVTVGFFEVDDSTTPPMLLSEIGYAQGRHTRHRMFAIVDRSQMTASPGPQTNYSIRGNNPPNNNQIVPYWTVIK